MIRPVPTVGAAAEPGTPGGVSRREFVRALTAGSAAALAAGVRSPAAQAGAAARMRAAQAEAPDDEAFWADVRHEFLIPEELAYMNSGTLGPMPKPVYYAVVDGYRALAADPGRTNTAQNSVQNELREKPATFVNADTDEVALTRNTTEGMSFVANGLDLDPGDEVLLSFHEHPGGLQPWRLAAARRGVVVKELPFPIPTSDPSDIVGLFEAAITPRTKVISVSHVTFATGCMLPVRELAALARPRGIVTVVDGAHAIGMLHLDMHDLGMDCYASSPYKWMGAPVGSGFLYMRRDVQDRIWPTVVTTGWDDAEGGAARFDRLSQRAGPIVAGTAAAIDFQEAIGRERIERRIRTLAARLRDRLTAIPEVTIHTSVHPALTCGITGFALDGFDRRDIVETLWRRHHVWVRHTDFDLNTVRVSTHLYNTEEQVDRLAAGIRDILEHGALQAPEA